MQVQRKLRVGKFHTTNRCGPFFPLALIWSGIRSLACAMRADPWSTAPGDVLGGQKQWRGPRWYPNLVPLCLRMSDTGDDQGNSDPGPCPVSPPELRSDREYSARSPQSQWSSAAFMIPSLNWSSAVLEPGQFNWSNAVPKVVNPTVLTGFCTPDTWHYKKFRYGELTEATFTYF